MDFVKARHLRVFVVLIFVIIAVRLFYLQIVENQYKIKSDRNILRYEVQYSPRGEVFDRNGEYIVQSTGTYDLMVIPRDVEPFDTLRTASVLGLSFERFQRDLKRAYNYSRRQPSVVVKMLTREEKLRFDELRVKGFYTIYRTIRSYPRKIAGNMLGYVGEVSQAQIDRDDYYQSGDYIGMSGVESAYEEELRGEKGIKVNMVNVHGLSQGSYANGAYDTPSVLGSNITCSIDAELQQFGEELLRGKVGSIVAIEPSSGEILLMASSPSYDPDELVGRQRGNNYMKLLNNPRRPLFNRAVMSYYPPGSIFKLVNGLIGMQEGVLVPSMRYPCHDGYRIGRGVKCHSHPSPIDLQGAVQTSCNAYFCYVMRDIIDNDKYKNVKEGIDVWHDYVTSFGFGRKLASDFLSELNGFVPDSKFYDNYYDGRWHSLTTLSLSIGQGELGCTPLQMANLAVIVANRGYYYTPHVVSRIHDRDSIDSRFYDRHYAKIDAKYFDSIIDGMYDAVHKKGGTALIARIPGVDLCGKTGTAENPHGADHSTFICFAPKDNPKISVSVYIENGRFGATVAAPIASLIVEKYLNDTVTRPYLVDYVKNMKINYPVYDK